LDPASNLVYKSNHAQMSPGSSGIARRREYQHPYPMKNIAIVYFSGTGYTALLAEAVAAGVNASGTAKAELIRVEGKDITEGRYENAAVFEKLAAADGIIFGSPTYMGGVAGQFKAFIDASGGTWFGRGWSGKIAAAFTTSGSPSGDKQGTLSYLHTLASQHGMIWVSANELPSFYQGKTDGLNRLGSFSGVMGQNTNAMGAEPVLDPGDRLSGEKLGERVAAITAKF
jgi:NAD(P)H dehydrogenase (quinone)